MSRSSSDTSCDLPYDAFRTDEGSTRSRLPDLWVENRGDGIINRIRDAKPKAWSPTFSSPFSSVNHAPSIWSDEEATTTNCRKRYITLTDLPTELLISIYGFSLNPSLRLTCHNLWACLDSESARLWFCINAFSPTVKREIGFQPAVRLQKDLLNQSWFADHFTKKMEKAVDSSLSVLDDGPAFKIIDDVPIPSRLLKGQWTDERINLFERLLLWGSYVIDTPPLCHKLPAKLLTEAIRQSSSRGVRLCREWLGVRFVHAMFVAAIRSRSREDVVEEIVVDHFTRPVGFIDWQDDELVCRALDFEDSAHPTARWYFDVLCTKGASIWSKYQSELKQQNSN
ncbi:uncharacterized protein KY384_008980 [Bacidia gigantensis]|uniref:uncharacterized protein n=1 Tax=Bacidia gigantensis TaxID=2732470 RepID=UPI001D059DDB|nr:uncharacterized protein KY384_008980 [Bacidia gigantensis]KAG8525336.1 hypothetical protein KY384_008980 [Bacidia gigantensis]